MAVSGVGLRSTGMIQSLVEMNQKLSDLQRQIGTGQKSQDYAGLGLQRGLAVGLHAQMASIDAYDDSMANINVRLQLGQTSLSRLSDLARQMKGAISAASTSTAQINQQSAQNALAEMLGLLNVQAGDRYLFSGLATDKPAVESLGNILDGNGNRAGLKQFIAERNQADLGTTGLGRLVLSAPTPTSVAVGEDVAGSPFGFKLANISSTLTGATATSPAGAPPAMSIDLGATNPNAGETVTFSFNLPDGSSEKITLTATNSATPGANEFTIGATSADTAANLQTTLNNAVGQRARTALAAASAVQASNEFFDADVNNPPLRVAGPPFDTATSLTPGTAANSVIWYTGEAGTAPARSTAVGKIDPSLSVSYGMRANEQGIRTAIQNVATLAAVSFSTADPDAANRSAALNDRLRPALDVPPGAQKIEDIAADLAGAQQAIAAAKSRHQQTKATLTDLLQGIEGISNDEVAAQILALQTSLQASYMTTAKLYDMSLVKYL